MWCLQVTGAGRVEGSHGLSSLDTSRVTQALGRAHCPSGRLSGCASWLCDPGPGTRLSELQVPVDGTAPAQSCFGTPPGGQCWAEGTGSGLTAGCWLGEATAPF